MVDESNMEVENEDDLNQYRGILLEMEFDNGEIELCTVSMIAYAIEIVTKWKEDQMIDGVLGLDNKLLEGGFDHHNYWMIALRIIQKKQYVLVETILKVKTEASTFNFYRS